VNLDFLVNRSDFMKFYLSFDVSIYLFYLMEVPEEEQSDVIIQVFSFYFIRLIPISGFNFKSLRDENQTLI
jgi:hypothetical protein